MLVTPMMRIDSKVWATTEVEGVDTDNYAALYRQLLALQPSMVNAAPELAKIEGFEVARETVIRAGSERLLTREELMAEHLSDNPRIRPARKGAIAHHLIGLWLSGKIAPAMA